MNNIEKKSLRFINLAMAFLLLSGYAAASWDEPPLNPPAGSLPPPITIGENLQSSEDGTLYVNNITAKTGAMFGSVRVGSPANVPVDSVSVEGKTRTLGRFCIRRASGDGDCIRRWADISSLGSGGFSGGQGGRLAKWSAVDSINNGVSSIDDGGVTTTFGLPLQINTSAGASALRLIKLTNASPLSAVPDGTKILTLDSSGNVVLAKCR
jgi:hypothetical protein